MKDIDAVFHSIDSLINKYLVAAFILSDNDVHNRPFGYNFDVFLIFSNPRHVKYVDLLPDYTTVTTILTTLVQFHISVRFSLSCSSVHSVSTSSSLLRIVFPLADIIQLSFESVIHAFGSQLASLPGSIVNHYILETSILNYRVASNVPSGSRLRFTTLSYFYHHLYRLHQSRTTLSTLISPIKPCVYRVTCFSNKHQSCHYFNYCDNLILDSYVSSKKSLLS